MSYPAYSCTAGPSEELAEEIIQKTSGTLSIVGSSLIVVDVVRKLRLRDATAADSYQRIMLGLSFFDALHSFFDSFMGTWMTPAETGWLMASGNEATCTTQGFFFAFGFFGAFGYQMALSLNLLVLIAFGWSQKKFARKIEIPIHIFIISVALIFAVVPLPLEGYNADCGQCVWKEVYDESGNIVRGSPKLQDLYWTIFWAYLWATMIFCTTAMAWVYSSVRKQENRMKRYSVQGVIEEHHRESKRIRKILLLYTIALWVCWGIPFTIIFVFYKMDGWPTKAPFALRAMVEALIPLVGWFNMLVYFLPKCLKRQQKNPGTWLVTSYFHVLFGCGPTVPCSGCRRRDVIVGSIEDEVGESPPGDEKMSPLLSQRSIPAGTSEKTEESSGTNFATFNRSSV